MKRIVFLILILTFILTSPTVSKASYLIYLKSGGCLFSSFYWKEHNEIKIYTIGGVIGIDETAIKQIKEECVLHEDKNLIKNKMHNINGINTAQPKAETEIKSLEEPIDLEEYKNKKDKLMIELDDLMERKRKAASIGDNDSKEKIMQEIRQTSRRIYKITDEVKGKSKGKLPEGWWDKKNSHY